MNKTNKKKERGDKNMMIRKTATTTSVTRKEWINITKLSLSEASEILRGLRAIEETKISERLEKILNDDYIEISKD